MAGLQRSAQTFRRSGSSGLVWDERFLTEDGGGAPLGSSETRRPELLRHSRSVGVLRRGEAAGAEHGDRKRTRLVLVAAKPKQEDQRRKQQQHHQEEEEEMVPGTGRKAFRSRDVAPAAEPPSPRVPAGCCAIFRASGGGASSLLARRAKPRKR